MRRIITICAVLIALTSCDKNDDGSANKTIELNESSLSLYYEQTFQLSPTSGNSKGITWASDNRFVATVSATGLVEAQRIGKATITANNATCEVTVKPKYNLYTEPYMGWGASKADIKSKYGNYPKSETATGLMYQVTNLPNAVHPFNIFTFENGKLSSVCAVINTSYSSGLTSFLLERYLPVAVDPNGDIVALFVNGIDDITLSVGLGMYEISYWMVIYLPYTSVRSNTGSDFKSIQNSLIEILNNQSLNN